MTVIPSPRSTNSGRAGGAEGVGLATVTTTGVVLDTWFPHPRPAHPPTSGTQRLTRERASAALGTDVLPLLGIDPVRDVEVIAVHTRIARLTDPPVDTHDTYLRLHLLSRHLVDPDAVTLYGALELLPMVVWTNHGPCPVAGFNTIRARLRARGPVTVHRVDRLPRLLDYTLPSNTLAVDADDPRANAAPLGWPLAYSGRATVW